MFITISMTSCQDGKEKPALHYTPREKSPFRIQFDYPGDWVLNDSPEDTDLLIIGPNIRWERRNEDFFIQSHIVLESPYVDIFLTNNINDLESFNRQVNIFTENNRKQKGFINYKLEAITINGLTAYHESFTILNTEQYRYLVPSTTHDLYKEKFFLFVNNQMIEIYPCISDIHDDPGFSQGYMMIVNSIQIPQNQ